jgi:pimeloyl-ACP methyl ester carboxylesterase
MAWIAARHPSLRKPALLGWSLGAATAHMVAAERQAALSAVILYGYAPDPGSVILPVSESVQPTRERNSPEAAASDFIVPELTDPAIVHAFIEKAMQTDPIHVDWRDEEQFLCDSSGINVPTLILFGERDPNVDANEVIQFFRRLGTNEKQIMVLPGADHCAHLESTHEAWIAAVVDFLNRPGVFAPVK